MTLWEVARFEVAYQLRRPWTWIYFTVPLLVNLFVTYEAYNSYLTPYHFNSPLLVAALTLLGSITGLLATAALAGEAAARDVQSQMHPLLYSSPVGKRNYLFGRFLAAFALNAFLLLLVEVALFLSPFLPNAPAELIGPIRPMAYVGAYVLIALPNAFIGTALLFCPAVLKRRPAASFISLALMAIAGALIYPFLLGGRTALAQYLEPMGIMLFGDIFLRLADGQSDTFAIATYAPLFWNRLIWLSVATCLLLYTCFRFRFEHVTTRSWLRRAAVPDPDGVPSESRNRSGAHLQPVFDLQQRFDFVTQMRQVFVIAARSFRQIALSWAGLAVAGLATFTLIMESPTVNTLLGVPLLPTTQFMTAAAGTGRAVWLLVRLFTLFYVGEMVWREREVGISEIADASPTPDWVRLVGRLTGLGLVFVAFQMLMMTVCMLIQAWLGYTNFEIGLYVQILFGIQVADYFLFLMLVFAVHVVVNQKYFAHTLVVLFFFFRAEFRRSGSVLGIEHKMLVYSTSPNWQYSDMRGFAPTLTPWVWFTLYWGAWALLLAVLATLFWIRGKDTNVAARVRLAFNRLTRPILGASATAAVLVIASGGFIFYNTNVLNAFDSAADRAQRSVDYEVRYGQFANIPQPQLDATTLNVEIYPDRGEAEIRATYRVVNRSGGAMDSVHVSPRFTVETSAVDFDRPATLTHDDEKLGYRIYTLKTPLMPGDSTRMSFTVRFGHRGFTNNGIDPSVAPNGTYIEAVGWLPAVGYQRIREIADPSERKKLGLPERPALPSPSDLKVRQETTGFDRVAFDTTVGTSPEQVAVAPGALQRTWMENGRRYFHYVTDTPIRPDFAIYSAAYAVHEARWNDVSIQIFHHASHSSNLDKMVRSIQASMDYMSKTLGPYPHRQIRFVERYGDGDSLHSSPVNISYQEGFARFQPDPDPQTFSFPFAVVAHETAHQWWGNQLTPARAEGAALLTESLAWYSAMRVVEQAYGRDHLDQLLASMRQAYVLPSPRGAPPLLRASDWFHAYRKGPFAFYALDEYIGAEHVDDAISLLFEKHRSGTPPLPTSLDLYRELKAVTPASLQPLLADLFETNTFWSLVVVRATSQQMESGAWQVKLDFEAHKQVVDEEGGEADSPVNDLVEVGVFGNAKNGRLGDPLYLGKHHVRSGRQSITVTTTSEPARAGIDPRGLLFDQVVEDNLMDVTRVSSTLRN